MAMMTAAAVRSVSHSLVATNLRIAIPDFLAPSVFCGFPTERKRNVRSPTPSTFFSTTVSVSSRNYVRRDGNFQRGVSPLRRTGLNGPLAVDKEPLPKPVLDSTKRSKVDVDPSHGLWAFFREDKAALPTPEQSNAHGRGWTMDELRRKSWEDLHSLWWVCAKERNRIATGQKERKRLELETGEMEDRRRRNAIKRTQAAIKHVLTERWYAWEDARTLAAKDPHIDLSGQGPAYMPYEVEERNYELESKQQATQPVN